MINWWYTNSDGNEYMTFLGCALNDEWVVWTTLILCSAIVLTYLNIALESYNQGKQYPNSITKRYLLDKTFVFVFCALSGYGYTVLSAFVNPYKFRIVMLGGLLFWSIKLLKSLKRRNIIERIYEGEKLIEEKVQAYRKLKEVKEIASLVNVEDGKSEFISFETIKKAFPKGSEEDLGGGKLIFGLDAFRRNGLDIVVLRGKMPKGETYTLNHHDCEEFIVPLDGQAIEMFSKEDFNIMKVFEIGDNIKHGFIATEDFEFLSILIKK